jgi:hypothetical protein
MVTSSSLPVTHKTNAAVFEEPRGCVFRADQAARLSTSPAREFILTKDGDSRGDEIVLLALKLACVGRWSWVVTSARPIRAEEQNWPTSRPESCVEVARHPVAIAIAIQLRI